MIVIDKRQYEIQKFVDRKQTSSYYTDEDGMKVIAMLLKKLNVKGDFSLMDHFMGAENNKHYSLDTVTTAYLYKIGYSSLAL